MHYSIQVPLFKSIERVEPILTLTLSLPEGRPKIESA